MMRCTWAALTKLVVVESPNKVIKIEGLLSNAKVIPDWSFGDGELRGISTGPEKAVAMATAGHFMALKEVSWTPRSAALSAQDDATAATCAAMASAATNDSFPANGMLASFALEWELMPGRKVQDTVTHYVKDKLRDMSEIIVATDPDREGELIAVHALHLIRSMFPDLRVPFTRAYIHSITEDGVRAAMRTRRRAFDHNLANAAEARHAMDRIFGFLGSSVVRYANPQMRSIGRVQTPALILIKEREDKILQYVQSHTTTYEVRCLCHFPAPHGKHFTQSCVVRPRQSVATGTAPPQTQPRDDGVDWGDVATVRRMLERWQLGNAHGFVVDEAPQPQVTVTPPPAPFTMAMLIAKANRQLRLSSETVSSCLQDLFQMGHITYPRTDSSRIDDTVLPSIYSAVCAQFGKGALSRLDEREGGGGTRASASSSPSRGRAHGGQPGDAHGNVEDAHEAVRPTNILLRATDLGAVASSTKQVYELIRRNTLAAFMKPLRTERVCVTVHFTAGNGEALMLQLVGKHTLDAGWTAAFRGKGGGGSGGGDKACAVGGAEAGGGYSDDAGLDAAAMDEGVAVVPHVSDEEFAALVALCNVSQRQQRQQRQRSGGDAKMLRLESWQVAAHKPTPPLPYLEGALIEELKNHGVGRPSTYPMIVKTLLSRNYITMNKDRCETTPVGRMLVETSRTTFPSIVDIRFTASFEKQLDRIAKPDDVLSSAARGAGTGGGATAASGAATGASLTVADYVLSAFVSRFLNYVTEATRARRAAQLQCSSRQTDDETQPPQAVDRNSGSEAPTTQAYERSQPSIVAMVPDLLERSRAYRTFTALQNALYDYLRRYFPPPTAAACGPPTGSARASGGVAQRGGSSCVTSTAASRRARSRSGSSTSIVQRKTAVARRGSRGTRKTSSSGSGGSNVGKHRTRTTKQA